MSEHYRDSDFMPDKAKWIANFIQRIGFPILMCLILSYFCLIALDRNTKVLGELKDVMIAVKTSLDARR